MKVITLNSLLSLLLIISTFFACQKNNAFTGLISEPELHGDLDSLVRVDIEPVLWAELEKLEEEEIEIVIDENPPKEDPVLNSLFMGNSFFWPVARIFNEVASEQVSGHRGWDVGAPNQQGVPRALWEDLEKRDSILSILRTGEVDLFGMLSVNRSRPGYSDQDTATWDIPYYRNWIDAALEANPNTVFFMGALWHPIDLGPSTPDFELFSYEEYYALSDFNIRQPGQALVELLRELYPKNKFYSVWYGELTCELKKLQLEGNLGGVTNWAGPKETSIHQDDIGHMGVITGTIAPLIWMHVIYGPESIPPTEYLDVDCDAIARKIGNNILTDNPY